MTHALIAALTLLLIALLSFIGGFVWAFSPAGLRLVRRMVDGPLGVKDACPRPPAAPEPVVGGRPDRTLLPPIDRLAASREQTGDSEEEDLY